MRRLLALALAVGLAAPLSGETPEQRFQTVTVKPGDTLWGIAHAYLKDPTRWNELLEYNRLPTSDPTVTLPGMILKVPVTLIKDSMLAATLVAMINEVVARKRETPEWKPAALDMLLLKDDALRTMTGSRARVAFVTGEILNLDENSMAVLKPRSKDADLELLRGEVHSAGPSRVITSSALITPKAGNTRFSASIRDDLSTVVQVYTGMAEVKGAGKGKGIEVKGGYSTEVPVDSEPLEPVKLPDTALFQARILGGDVFDKKLEEPGAAAKKAAAARGVPTPKWTRDGIVHDITKIGVDLKALNIEPLSAWSIQISKDEDFARIMVDRIFEADLPIDLTRAVAPGVYWVRVAARDLFGAQGRFSQARTYSVPEPSQLPNVDEDRFHGHVEIVRPEEMEDYTRVPKYRIMGRADKDLTLTVNGRRMRMDEDGNFSLDVLLKEGSNRFKIQALDTHGRARELIRSIYYEP